MWGHRIPSILVEFLNITHVYGELLITEGHYMYANGKMLTARSVKVGDFIPLINGTMSQVISIGKVADYGLYNPQTRDGNIVVNGVVVTVYTDFMHPTLAKNALFVAGVLTDVGIDVVGNNAESMNAIPSWAHGLVSMLPSGPQVLLID